VGTEKRIDNDRHYMILGVLFSHYMILEVVFSHPQRPTLARTHDAPDHSPLFGAGR
jgi:hypothetical protein